MCKSMVTTRNVERRSCRGAGIEQGGSRKRTRRSAARNEVSYRAALIAVFPRPSTRSVSDVQDYDLITLDCIENRISKSRDVPASYARNLRFLCQIGIMKKLSGCVVDALRKIHHECRSVRAKVGYALFELVRCWVGVSELHLRDDRASFRIAATRLSLANLPWRIASRPRSIPWRSASVGRYTPWRRASISRATSINSS